MSFEYTIANIQKSGKGAKADLLEDGIAIAKVTRTAGTRTSAPEFTAKFYTDASRNRFIGFCDSLSICETLEAMMGYN